MKFVNIACLLLLSTAALGGNKCCHNCPEGKIKYYSIDKKNDRCGEYCLNPKNVWLHTFEGLQKAEVKNPCSKLGYSKYETTETRGAVGMKVTLDKYRKPQKIMDYLY